MIISLRDRGRIEKNIESLEIFDIQVAVGLSDILCSLVWDLNSFKYFQGLQDYQ